MSTAVVSAEHGWQGRSASKTFRGVERGNRCTTSLAATIALPLLGERAGVRADQTLISQRLTASTNFGCGLLAGFSVRPMIQSQL